MGLEQAGLLRDMAARPVNTPLDLENPAKEFEDAGKAQLQAAQNQVVRTSSIF